MSTLPLPSLLHLRLPSLLSPSPLPIPLLTPTHILCTQKIHRAAYRSVLRMPDPGATAAANSIGFLFTELVKHIKEWKDVREDCDQMQRDLVMCVAFREDVLRRGGGCCTNNIVREYDEELRELVHDIQDCIERFLYRVTCKDEARWIARKGHAIWTWRIRRRFANKLKNLNKRLQKSGVDKIRHLNVGTTAAPPPAATRSPIEENPVGIDQAKKELLTLLNKEGHEPARLRVIAVVGFGGSGKTTLVKASYQSASAQGSFDLCAWVDRADYLDACGLLKTIILKFWKEEKSLADSSNEKDLQDVFKDRLKNQRYINKFPTSLAIANQLLLSLCFMSC